MLNPQQDTCVSTNSRRIERPDSIPGHSLLLFHHFTSQAPLTRSSPLALGKHSLHSFALSIWRCPLQQCKTTTTTDSSYTGIVHRHRTQASYTGIIHRHRTQASYQLLSEQVKPPVGSGHGPQLGPEPEPGPEHWLLPSCAQPAHASETPSRLPLSQELRPSRPPACMQTDPD